MTDGRVYSLNRNLHDSGNPIFTIVNHLGDTGLLTQNFFPSMLLNSVSHQIILQQRDDKTKKVIAVSKNKNRIRFPLILIFVSILSACLILPSVAHAGNFTAGGNNTLPVSTFTGITGVSGNETGTLTLILFYNPNCSECQRILGFLPGFLEKYPDTAVESYNIENNSVNHDLLHRYGERYGKPDVTVPAVFVGDQGFVGYEEITSGLASAVVAARTNGTLYPLTPLPTPTDGGHAGISYNESTSLPPLELGKLGNGPAGLMFILFYNRKCHECQKVLDFLPGFLEKYPDIAVISYDVANNAEYNNLFQQYNTRFGRPLSPVPAVFIGERELVGYEEITSGLDAAIAAARVNGTLYPLTPLPTPTPNLSQPSSPSPGSASALTVPLIISAALVDGINPCAFAVLVFLLVTILSLESRRKVLAVGGAYTFAVFIFYFLSGLGIFAIVQITGLSTVFSLVAAVIALIAGILMLRDALGTNKPILAIPESRKAVIDTYIRKSSIPAAFILGILVGIFELPCTGGIYLAILSLLSQSMSLAEGIPYLLLYNIFFVVPLLIIIAAVSWGISPERLATLREGNRRLIRFGMAMVMIAIAVFLIYTALR